MAGKTMIPLLAFAAWSGTGKTTLLKKLIPALCARGIRPGLIKHTHHDMDVDKPGKDSYELRKAGAAQTIVAPAAMGLDDGNTRRRRAGSTFSRKSNGYLKAGFDSGRRV